MMKLYIANISCGGCARGVSASIKEVDPQAVVEVDVAQKLVDLQTSQPLEPILAALAEDGFPAEQCVQ